MDGVIIDSEPLQLQSFNHVLQNYGAPFSLEEFKKRYMGYQDISICGMMVAELNLPITKEEFVSAKRQAYLEILQNEIQPIPGVVEAIKEIQQMMPIGLASSSNKSEIEIITKKLGIYNLFSALVSSFEVVKGKPAPDIYLKVSELLEVPSQDCGAIEDSKLGVAAAKSAGIYCLGITTTHTAAELAEADQVITNFDQLVPALKKLL